MAKDTTTTAANFFKTHQRDFMSSDVPGISPLYGEIERAGKKIEIGGASNQTKWAAKSYDGVGIGSLSEGGDFPTPDSSAAINFTLSCSHLAFSSQWTGHLVAQGSSKRSSWAGDYVKMKSKEIRNKVRSVIARLAASDGTGNFGQVSAVSGTTNGYITVTGATVHMFNKGETLTIRDAASSGSEQLTGGAGSGLIKDIDYVNNRVYLADVSGANANDYIAISGLYDATVPEGIQSIVAQTGTIQNVNRATVGNYLARAIYQDASSASLASSDVDELRDLVEDVRGLREGSYRSKWCGNRKMRRWAILATIGQNRFAGLDTLQLGTAKMKIGEKSGTQEFMVDQYLTDGDLYCIDPSKWFMAFPEGMKGGYALENNGSVFFQATAASGTGHSDSQYVYWIWRGNIGCDDFRAQGRRTNIVSP